jgi:acetyl esterase/lipase
VRDRISRLDENAIVTENGATHSVDAVIYGTGFSATRFLAPMRFTGRDGQDLHAAWRDGASAYLGLAVPGFPNFFMLYGPNTNLGHNSIIVMLESQIAHVMRVRSRMVATDATAVEIRRPAHELQDTRIQSRLARTVWTGCTSWYVDANGRNSVNWPGFTLTYRWLARRRGLDDYQFTRAAAGETVILPPGGRFERTNATLLRAFLAIAFKPFAGPPFTAPTQRRVVGVLSPLMPGLIGSARQTLREGDLHIRVVTPPGARRDAAILYLHGGAFCLGNPGTHRAITTRLARRAGLPVHVPDYRLAPEHPYPAAIDDALAAWRRMTSGGIDPGRILIAGDSAGGALALALALRLRDLGEASPAGVALISPVTDPAAGGDTVTTHARIDPMIRRGWLAQGLAWHACPPTATEFHPLTADLSGLPPLLIQVGDQEILLSDSRRLAAHARRCGVDVRLEVHGARWHVFHLQSFLLKSARYALAGIADFAREATSPKSESIRDRGPAAKRAKGQALETY